jgi:hypothetical protein
MKKNAEVIELARKRVEQEFGRRMFIAFREMGDWLIKDAEAQAGYRNLTGNTITSIACGVYRNYMLQEIYYIDGKNPPIREKLVQGEYVVDFLDYDGNVRRFFKAEIDTDGGFGRNTAASFLLSHRPGHPDGIVITTGTEYSEFLESVLELNVLTDTQQTARRGARAKFLTSFVRA